VSLVAALTRGDVADYVDALVTVYFVLILLNIMLSWVQQFRPIPYNLALRAVTGFIDETTTPYLNVFRRLGLRIGPLDLSPIVATILLFVVGGIVAGLIRG
jgi:YggT family protein